MNEQWYDLDTLKIDVVPRIGEFVRLRERYWEVRAVIHDPGFFTDAAGDCKEGTAGALKLAATAEQLQPIFVVVRHKTNDWQNLIDAPELAKGGQPRAHGKN